MSDEEVPDEAADEAADEAETAAYRLLEQLRWGGRPDVCPHCGSGAGAYFLRPADGIARTTRTGSRSVRRVWKCSACRRQFSVLTGTVLECTRSPLRVWVAAANADRGDPRDSRALRERHGLSASAAARVADLLDAVAAPTPGQTLAALLRLDPARAAQLRERGRRRRPLRQLGPSAEYGLD
jgi:transposase-like protein